MDTLEFERYVLIGLGALFVLMLIYTTIRFRIRKRKFYAASRQRREEMERQGKTIDWDYHKWAREWSANYPPAPKFMMRISRMMHGNPF